MKPGDLRRWKYPKDLPAAFDGSEIFMITRVEDDRTDFLINGRLVKSWSRNWVCKHSKELL